MSSTRWLLTTLMTGAVLAACGDGDSTTGTAVSEPATTSSTTRQITSIAPQTSETPTSEPAPTSTMVGTTTTRTSPTTSTAPSDGEVFATSLEVPDGDFVAAPGDLIVLRSNQDLEYWPNALSPGNEAPHILLAAVDQRDGFTSVSDVGGIVNGSVVFATPTAEHVFAVDEPRSVAGPVADGEHLELSPDGTRLGLARPSQLTIVDVATGVGASLQRDPSDDDYRPIVDLDWLDEDTVVTLTVDVDAGTYWLEQFDAETLRAARGAVEFETPARFAGRTADGLLALVLSEGDSLRLVNLDAKLEERPDLEQFFPLAGFSFIEIDPGGLGQVWVDGGRLHYLGPGQFEARELDQQVLQAWFVEST